MRRLVLFSLFLLVAGPVLATQSNGNNNNGTVNNNFDPNALSFQRDQAYKAELNAFNDKMRGLRARGAELAKQRETVLRQIAAYRAQVAKLDEKDQELQRREREVKKEMGGEAADPSKNPNLSQSAFARLDRLVTSSRRKDLAKKVESGDSRFIAKAHEYNASRDALQAVMAGFNQLHTASFTPTSTTASDFLRETRSLDKSWTDSLTSKMPAFFENARGAVETLSGVVDDLALCFHPEFNATDWARVDSTSRSPFVARALAFQTRVGVGVTPSCPDMRFDSTPPKPPGNAPAPGAPPVIPPAAPPAPAVPPIPPGAP